MIFPISADDFSIMINKGIMQRGAFTEYYEHKRVISHLKKVHETLSAREELVKQLDARAVAPMIEAHNEIKQATTKRDDYKSMTDDEILAEFSDVGTFLTEAEMQQEYSAYVELWKAIHSKELESGKKKMYMMPIFDEWVKYGMPNAYDKKMGFYRKKVVKS